MQHSRALRLLPDRRALVICTVGLGPKTETRTLKCVFHLSLILTWCDTGGLLTLCPLQCPPNTSRLIGCKYSNQHVQQLCLC
ncbi:hypothetical protein FKM82_001662 [Ascaphus truei]